MGGGDMICNLMEAWKGVPYKLPRQGLLSCELLSSLVVGILHLYWIICHHWNQAGRAMGGALVYPCCLFGQHHRGWRLREEKSSCFSYLWIEWREISHGWLRPTTVFLPETGLSCNSGSYLRLWEHWISFMLVRVYSRYRVKLRSSCLPWMAGTGTCAD